MTFPPDHRAGDVGGLGVGASEEKREGGLGPRRRSPGRDQSEFHRWRNLISSRHSDIIMWLGVCAALLEGQKKKDEPAGDGEAHCAAP